MTMSRAQWLAVAGFVAVVSALLLVLARLQAGAAIALVAGFGLYSVAVLRDASRVPSRVTRRARLRRARDAAPSRTWREPGPR